MKKLLLALILSVAFLGRAYAQIPEPFTPQNSAILLVDHQILTVHWVQSLPRQTLIGDVRVLARLGSAQGCISPSSSHPRWSRPVTDGNQILTELYPDFGTAEGQKAAQINMEEIISKLPTGEQGSR